MFNYSKEFFYHAAHRYRPELLILAKSLLRDQTEAEDAVSDALLKAESKIHQLKDPEKLFFWLKRIVHNHCLDILRQKKKGASLTQEGLVPDEGSDISERIIIAEKIEHILDIMLAIRPKIYREVLILFFYHKMDYAHMAKDLAISQGTVKSRLSRAKKKLKESFSAEGITEEDLLLVKDMDEWPLILE